MSPGDLLAGRRRIAVVGAGIVGVRVARELLSPGAGGASTNSGVVMVTRRPARAAQLRSSFGRTLDIRVEEGRRPALPDDVAVVVVARESVDHADEVRHHLDAGRHVVSTADDPLAVTALLSLDVTARSSGSALVVGAAMSPGLTCLLARHGAAELDRVDEIHVARHGAGGPACARQRLRALRGSGSDWRDGGWLRRPGFSGRELCWFPDPIGARDCYRGALSEPLLLAPTFPDAQRITARVSASRRDRALAPFPVLLPPPVEGGVGAVRVELRGKRDGARHTVVLGALDRPTVATAGVGAVVALWLLDGSVPPGAHGLASLPDTLAILQELDRRGVRAARFEGSAPETPSTENPAESVQNRPSASDSPH
jgi:hypothetical protein